MRARMFVIDFNYFLSGMCISLSSKRNVLIGLDPIAFIVSAGQHGKDVSTPIYFRRHSILLHK